MNLLEIYYNEKNDSAYMEFDRQMESLLVDNPPELRPAIVESMRLLGFVELEKAGRVYSSGSTAVWNGNVLSGIAKRLQLNSIQSGGVNISGIFGDVNISGDIVGGDKICKRKWKSRLR